MSFKTNAKYIDLPAIVLIAAIILVPAAVGLAL
jgi:hypothetical protein